MPMILRILFCFMVFVVKTTVETTHFPSDYYLKDEKTICRVEILCRRIFLGSMCNIKRRTAFDKRIYFKNKTIWINKCLP